MTYSEITSNKRRTWVLVILMSTLIIGLSWLIGLSSGLEPSATIALGTIFATIYSLISYYASSSITLAVSGAKPIEKSQAPDLFNIVENLCIANGQPLPAIYIIEDRSPNAFATGRGPETASIAFTTGILALLDRKELEGVAAHELSHVKNYDIRVMTLVVVLVGCISLMANILIHIRIRGDSKDNNLGLIFMIIGIVLAILSPLIAELIQLAVSRSREFLADASGALLTRYPDGLASALQKIENANIPLQNPNPATAHLFLSNPFGATAESRSFFRNLFATHPPIEERIKRLRSMGR